MPVLRLQICATGHFLTVKSKTRHSDEFLISCVQCVLFKMLGALGTPRESTLLPLLGEIQIWDHGTHSMDCALGGP